MGNHTILLVLINNPDSISTGAGDPRFSTLVSVGHELKRRGHTVLVEGAGALSSISPNKAKRAARGAAKLERDFVWLTRKTLAQHGTPHLLVSWFNLIRDSGDEHLVVKLLKRRDVPHLLYENGMTRGTITVDPKGFLGDSYYVHSLNKRVQRGHDDASCSDHVREHLRQDSSKRPQPTARRDLPRFILSNYVFIPTQKFSDVSVLVHSRITYPQLLQSAAAFCQRRRLPLVIKIHPHLVGRDRWEQERLIKSLRRNYRGNASIFTSTASINFLNAHALFTVTLNGGTLMDNFYAQSPVLTLARGFFDRTDGVVRDEEVERGMERMLTSELPWSETRKLRQRQIVCWYDRMCLKTVHSAAQNVAVLQEHLDALRLPLPIVL